MVSSDGGDLINGQDCFRVLIVDSSPTSLHNLEQLLKRCTYEVIKCPTAAEALSTLQEEKNKLDIVISDRQLSDMNGLDLLRQISEIDNRLPVIMVSAEESKEALWESMMAGACDHLVKPIKMEAINDLWKHGLRKKVECLKDLHHLHMMRSSDDHHQQFIISDHHADNPITKPATNKVIINCKKKKYTEVVDNILQQQQQHGGDINNDCSGSDHDQAGAPHHQNGGANKKQRLIWTSELHHNFIAAVNQLGGDKAVPKKILECMHSRGFTEITRENVASHLQKYRLHLQKKENPNYQKVDHAANCMESKKFSIFEQAAASPPLMSTCPRPSSIQYNSYNPCSTSPFLAPPATTPGVGLPLAEVDHHQANFLLEPKTQEPGGYIVYDSINNNYAALRNTATAIHGSVISNLPYKTECCTPIDQEYMFYSSMGNLHVVHDQQVRRPLPIDDEMAYEPAFVFRQQQQQQQQYQQQARDHHDIFHRVP